MNILILNSIPFLLFFLLIWGMEKRKDEFLSLSSSNALKGFAAIGVILHHLTQLNTNYNQVWKGPINFWNDMGILFTGIFFFLSGYGLWISFHNKNNYLDSFLKRRFSKILVPFFVSNIIYTFAMGIPFGILQRPILIITSLIGLTLVNTNAWYIVEILILYLFFYLFYKKWPEEKAEKGMICIVLGIIVIGLISGRDYTQYGTWFRGEWWYNTTLVFIVGMYFAKHKEKLIIKMKQNYSKNMIRIIVLYLFTMLINTYLLTHYGYYYEPNWWIGTLCKIASCLVQTIHSTVFIFFFLMINLKFKLGNKILYFIGNISLELYLIHNLFRLAAINLLGLQDTVFYVFVLMISILVAYPLHKLDQKIIRKLK